MLEELSNRCITQTLATKIHFGSIRCKWTLLKERDKIKIGFIV